MSTIGGTTKTLYFGSGTKLGELSNFALLPNPFYYKGYWWPSSENAYQAVFKVNEKDWHRFAVGGDLASLKTGIPLVFDSHEVEKKMKHYGPKKTGKPAMLGIVAKMAIKRDTAKKLNIEINNYVEENHLQLVSDLFIEILPLKYAANSSFKKKLEQTLGHELVEFDRGAERKAKQGKPPLWAGLIGKDGKLYGLNLQGCLHMQIRKRMFS